MLQSCLFNQEAEVFNVQYFSVSSFIIITQYWDWTGDD